MLRPLLLTIGWWRQGVPWRAAWSIAKAKCYLGQRPWWRRRFNVDRYLSRFLIALVWVSVVGVAVFSVVVAFGAVMYFHGR